MVVKQGDSGPDRVALTHRFMMVTRLARMPPYAVLSVHQRSVDSTPQLRGMKLMPEAMLIVRGTAHGHGLGHQFPMALPYRLDHNSQATHPATGAGVAQSDRAVGF